jgi:predicted kinase
MRLKEINTPLRAIMLIGLPGSGKSTWIRNLLSKEDPSNWVIASTDDILEKWGKEKGLNYNQAFQHFNFREVKDQMMKDIQNAIKKGKNIIFDQTNMNSKSRRDKLAMLPASYTKEAVVFSVPDTELKNRLQRREHETGKAIPPHVIDSMARNYEAPTKSEFDKITYVK